MPYETRYREVDVTKELGYDRIKIHRPRFIFFNFTGLRPSTPHWIWFGKKEVTKYCNTSYSKTDLTSAGRNSVLKEPGERFIKATQFPSGGGLPYGGPTATGGKNNPLFSNANGILKGLFYLQSNATDNWSISKSGQQLLAIDIYGLKKANAYSYAAAKFKGAGQYENFWKGKEKESYEVWVDPPKTVVDNSNDSKTTVTHSTVTTRTGNKGTKITFHNNDNDDKVTHHYSNGKFIGATRTVGGKPAPVTTFRNGKLVTTTHAPNNSYAGGRSFDGWGE
jgi:hypothetical protein